MAEESTRIKKPGLMPFYRKTSSLCIPVKVRLEVTRKCNLKCIHCKTACGTGLDNEFTPDDLARIVPQFTEAGTFEMNLSGGEPFARPDIIEILSILFENNILVYIQTNGTLVRSEHLDFIEKHRKNLLRIGVSLYSVEPEIHERVTRVKGSHRKTMNTLMELKERGLPNAVFTMLMSANKEGYEKTEEFLQKNNIFHQFGSLMVAREDGCSDPLKLRLADDELEEVTIPWARYMNPEPENASDYYPEDTPLSEWCVAGRYACILPSGELAPCSMIRNPIGDLKKQHFKEIWENSELIRYIRSLMAGDLECYGCEYFPRCLPCIGLAYQETGSYTSRPTEYCRMTRLYLEKP